MHTQSVNDISNFKISNDYLMNRQRGKLSSITSFMVNDSDCFSKNRADFKSSTFPGKISHASKEISNLDFNDNIVSQTFSKSIFNIETGNIAVSLA